MYYRRKILLALLEIFDNKLEKISLQKLLMLVTKQQEKPDFHFVPYKVWVLFVSGKCRPGNNDQIQSGES
jgi:hypothetical protein